MHGKYGHPVQGCGSLAKVGQWEQGGKSKQAACTVGNVLCLKQRSLHTGIPVIPHVVLNI